MNNAYWLELAVAISPDSGVFHGEGSAVADRRDVTLRWQPGAFGLLANWHSVAVDSELDQESYRTRNSVFGLGFTARVSPFGDSGFLGGTHLVGHLMGQTGRSDYHYFEGPGGGVKSEMAAGLTHALGVASGVDIDFPLFLGAWLSAGLGWESNNFDYKISTDPNDDGKVNLHQWFTYLRAGLSFSI